MFKTLDCLLGEDQAYSQNIIGELPIVTCPNTIV